MFKSISRDQRNVSSTAAKSSSTSIISNTNIKTSISPTQLYLMQTAKSEQKRRLLSELARKNTVVNRTTDEKNSQIITMQHSSSWSSALNAYYSAIFSGSNLGEAHAYSAVRTAVNSISKMPQNSASGVLASLASLSEESPMVYGPHCIEAAMNCISKESKNERKQISSSSSSPSALPTQRKMKLLTSLPSPSSSSQRQSDDNEELYKIASQTLSKHRLTLIDSSQKIACRAVSSCMSEGRWDAAIRIVTRLPNLLKSSNISDHSADTNSARESESRAIHLGAYVEALNQAVKHDHEKAVSTLLQLINQNQNNNNNNNNSNKIINGQNVSTLMTASNSIAPSNSTFFLNGLTSNDLKKMILGFENTEQGWKIASLLFGSRNFEISSAAGSSMLSTTTSAATRESILFNPAVVHASISLLASQNKWEDATRILQMKIAENDRSINNETSVHKNSSRDALRSQQDAYEQEMKQADFRKNNSAVISTAVKVLRHSPWNIALEMVSKLCATSCYIEQGRKFEARLPKITLIDNQAALDVVSLVLRLGQDAKWLHAASAFDLLNSCSVLRNNNTGNNQIHHPLQDYSHHHHLQQSQLRPLQRFISPLYPAMSTSQRQARIAIEAVLSSRLTVKLLNEGRPDMASRALRHVRSTGDKHALGLALNAFIQKAKNIPDCDTWITTMIEEGLLPTQQSKEHVIRLYCDEGNWVQALCAVRDLETTTGSKEKGFDEDDVSANSASVHDDEESQKVIISPKTHVYLQRSLRAAGAPWDVAVRSFVEVESNSNNHSNGNNNQSRNSDEKSLQQVAEAFRSVVATCMEQKHEEVAQNLFSLMIKNGVGRKR